MKKIKDERITKEVNKISAPLYLLIITFTIAGAIIKTIFLQTDLLDYVLEIIAVLGSIGYILTRTILSGIPLLPSKDESLRELQQTFLSHGFHFIVMLYVFGEYILMFFLDKLLIASIYIPIWFVPALIYTIYIVKKGLFVWGSKKAKQTGLKALKIRVVIGSLVFGIIVGWSDLFKDGAFRPKGLITVLLLAAGWGFLFYFFMKLTINKGEKISDKEVQEAKKD